ncbi:hypothetical protein RMATCC62417_11022 [Rhizopus microsporus]|nr:hypothetical protein RMATCC62417_11022 [Rhizopus microsporus]
MSSIIKPSSFNRSSPVIFPSASPTPKLYMTPSKKIPEVMPWQEMAFDAYHNPNIFSYEDSILKMKERYQLSTTMSPLSIIDPMDDLDLQLSEEDLLSFSSSAQNEIIIGSPFIPSPVQDPIAERLRQSTDTTSNKAQTKSSKLAFSKEFIQKVKKSTIGI